MARVFLGYRRADGRHAVGWIAERLGQLDVVAELRTAFQDSELRCGVDFPSALEDEVDGCDIVVAVIGPNWLGRRSDGPARILDPADWVAREVGTALAQNKRVLPVLVDGADPLSLDDLPDHLASLTADRLCVHAGARRLGGRRFRHVAAAGMGAARTWVLLVCFMVLLGPWILTALGVAWTAPSAEEFELGKRTRIISELDRVSWVAAAVLAAAGLSLVNAAVAFTQAATAIELEGRGEALVVVISWGLFLSGASIAVFLWSRVQLRNSSTALRRDLADVAPPKSPTRRGPPRRADLRPEATLAPCMAADAVSRRRERHLLGAAVRYRDSGPRARTSPNEATRRCWVLPA